MNPFYHQWKWDFRRIRTAWIIWIILLVLTTALRHAAFVEASRRSALLPISSVMEVVVIYLFGAALAIFAVFTTPFTGSSAFWKTRPLPARALAWEKSLLIGTMIWLPVLLSRAIQSLLIDSDPAALSIIALTDLPGTLAVYLLAALLAAISPDLRRLLLCIAVTIGAVLLFGLLTAFLRHGMDPAPLHFGNPGMISSWQTMVTGLGLLAAIMLAAWILGTFARHRTAAMVTAALAIAAYTSQHALWSVSFGPSGLPSTTLDLVVLDEHHPHDPSLAPLYPQLAAVLPKDQILVPYLLKSQFIRAHDEQVLHTGSRGGATSVPTRQLKRFYPANTRLIPSEHLHAINILNASGFEDEPGIFYGSCSAVIFRVRPLGSVPVQSDTTRKINGYGIVRVGQPDHQGNDFEITISSVTRNRHGDRHRHLPTSTNSGLAALLRHKASGTLVAPDYGGSSTGGGSHLIMQTEDFRFAQRALHTALGRPSHLDDLTEFEIDLYALTPIAEGHGEFRKEGWTPFHNLSGEPQELAAIDDSWTEAALPPNPTPDQVEAYLDTVMFGLPQGMNRARKDTLQAKLKALAPTHLDHLIDRLPVAHYIRHATHLTIHQNATRDHLPALLNAFRRDPAVAGMLIQLNLQDQAVDIARDHLRSPGPFASRHTMALITIATTTPDPSLNDDLLRHFVLADQWHLPMINHHRKQPGFPLDDAIAQAWARERAGLTNSPDLAYLAIPLGDPEALRQALAHFASLQNTQDRRYRDKFDLLDTAIDQPDGTNPASWAHTHFPHLQFHPHRHTFHLPTP